MMRLIFGLLAVFLWLAPALAETPIILKDGKPFEGTDHLDTNKIEALVALGIWTKSDLDKFDLDAAQPFAVPDGKVISGPARYVESKGKWSEEFDVIDAPLPPPPPTIDEKIQELFGVTPDKFREWLAGK